ncbi:uncharacterized protein At1g10890 [Etheostoma spectabile]|uniref:uncharacterized protein At1g10890 n=1 Tax=Etheostoma spectabile TaxID=54343 RepID=UPI0013AFB2CF|nr:uncharacterized protein At1g10890-like [Etheostoma spectabile]
MEQIKGEKEALKKEVETQKIELHKERQTLKVSKTNVELELESFLEMERAQAQEVKVKLSKMEEALREQEEAAKEKLEKSQAFHRAQLEMQDQSNKNFMAALEKKCEHQLERECVLWQQEKASLLEESKKTRASHVAQVDEQSIASDCLLAALKKTEQQLESNLDQWKEDKASLLQATERLKLTQQEKEQEWERTESTLRWLVELQSQIIQKLKKKLKWYKKLLPG